MFDLLLYSGMLCADADALVLRIQANKSELSPKNCGRTGRDRKGICNLSVIIIGTQTTKGTGLKIQLL